MAPWPRTLPTPATQVKWLCRMGGACLPDRQTPTWRPKSNSSDRRTTKKSFSRNREGRRNVKARMYGSFLTVAITATVVTGALLLLPLKPLAGQDAGKGAAKGGGKGAAKGGGYQ